MRRQSSGYNKAFDSHRLFARPAIDGYRRVPDALAGSEGLDIRDEVRQVRAGLYLGRAYFRTIFRLNFTLADPALIDGPTPPDGASDCGTLKK